MASQLQSLDEETPFSSRVESVAYQHPILSSSWPHYKHTARNTGVDLASALVAGSLVAPVVTVIDRSVVEASSGRTSILRSAQASLKELLVRPHHFLGSRAYGLILLLYGSTYFTSNTIDTIQYSNAQSQPNPSQINGLVKFGAVSAANMSLSLYKDSQFARLFGAGSRRALPPATFMLLTIRDGMTIFASFNLPPMVAPLLPESLETTFSRLSAAQLIVPALMQPINTPLHLLGLDLYNRNERLAVGERMGKIWREWGPASVARMSRVVMPFGVGNVVNSKLRAALSS